MCADRNAWFCKISELADRFILCAAEQENKIADKTNKQTGWFFFTATKYKQIRFQKVDIIITDSLNFLV